MMRLEAADLFEIDALLKRWGRGETGADVEQLAQVLEQSRARKPWLSPFVMLVYRLPGPKRVKAGRTGMSLGAFNARWREALQFLDGALTR